MSQRKYSVTRFSTMILVIACSGVGLGQTLSGRVYEGQTGTEPPPVGNAKPLAGVTLGLYGSDDAGDRGTGGLPIQTTTTNSEGWYSLTVRDTARDYYNIIQTDLAGYQSDGASSVGGTVKSSNWIQYRYEDIFITPVTTTGNKFWDTPISSGNNPPVAIDDSASTVQDTPIDIDVLTNDTDPDGDPLHVNSATNPPHGTVANHGTHVTYTPDTGYTGTDQFDYTAGDGKGGTDTATVTVTVATTPDLAPEIDIRGNDVSIANGDIIPSAIDGTDMGSVESGSGSVSQVFYIHNIGSDTLVIHGAEIGPDVFWVGGQIGGELAAQFGLMLLAPIPNTVAPGDSLPIGVELFPSAPGKYPTTLIIHNNDADENPYNFVVQGTGTVPTGGNGTILGTKFNDINYNGQEDPGEPRAERLADQAPGRRWQRPRHDHDRRQRRLRLFEPGTGHLSRGRDAAVRLAADLP